MAYETTTAIVDAMRERLRQLREWSPQHDDRYQHQELVRAAICYAYVSTVPDDQDMALPGFLAEVWPQNFVWRPQNRRRNLLKACALLIAEIERIDRAAHNLSTVVAQPEE